METAAWRIVVGVSSTPNNKKLQRPFLHLQMNISQFIIIRRHTPFLLK
jgi:hypothetical protein